MNSKGSSGLFFLLFSKSVLFQELFLFSFYVIIESNFPPKTTPILNQHPDFFSLRVHVDADIVYNELLTLASLKCRRCQETLEDKMLTLPRIMCLFPLARMITDNVSHPPNWLGLYIKCWLPPPPPPPAKKKKKGKKSVRHKNCVR